MRYLNKAAQKINLALFYLPFDLKTIFYYLITSSVPAPVSTSRTSVAYNKHTSKPSPPFKANLEVTIHIR